MSPFPNPETTPNPGSCKSHMFQEHKQVIPRHALIRLLSSGNSQRRETCFLRGYVTCGSLQRIMILAGGMDEA